MGIFVYSPSIRVLIDSSSAGTIDVSEDITAGQVQLRENGLHTMSIGLLNKRRKYDRAFSPNDRFVIYMKRVTEMLVMTGYLNVVPFVTAWQRTITLTGSCANKRLLYHFWDPGTIAAMTLLGTSNGNLGDQSTAADGGIADKINAVLHTVCEMPESKIHIGQIPSNWMREVGQLFNAVEKQIGNYWAALGGSNTQGSTPTASSTNAGSVLGQSTRKDAPKGAELPTTMGGVTSQAPLTTGIQPERDENWIAMQWGYRLPPDGNTNTPGIDKVAAGNWLAKRKLIVTNGNNNKSAVVYTVGWGPSQSNNDPNTPTSNAGVARGARQAPSQVQILASMCLSKSLMNKLGLNEGDDAMVAWVLTDKEPSVPFGMMSAATLADEQTWTTDNTYGSAPTGQVQTVSVAGVKAANYAASLCNNQPPIPYVWGGVGPNGYDCSGLTMESWLNGGKIQIPRTSEDQYSVMHIGSLTQDQLQPGDLIFYEGTPPGHVTMWLGGGQMAEAPHTGTNLHVTPFRTQDCVGFGRPSNADAVAGTTAIPAGSTAGDSSSSGTPTLLTQWDWFGQGPDPTTMILTGVRSLMNDQPILPFIDMLVKSSMRSWCSAPNGDFIAWFPDFFGLYGTAGVMEVSKIELQDFTVVWSDESLVTHQFTAGTYSPTMFGPSPGGPVSALNIATTMGVATIESPALLKALLNLSAAEMSPNGTGKDLTEILRNRFGVRPDFQPMQTVMGPMAEFWFALYLFQLNWSSQFNTVIPLTFMPELYPGMLIRLKDYGFQCYVTGVNHSFNLTQGGGFTTEAYVIAPSAIKGSGDTGSYGLDGLVKGGSFLDLLRGK